MNAARKHMFVSYAHADRVFGERVRTHLRGGLEDVEVWMDSDGIRVGDTWTDKIDEALARADMGVLLVSANFLASPFIREFEGPKLLLRHRDHGMPLLPILLEPCAWKSVSWISKLQMLPRWDKALSELERPHVDRLLGELVNDVARMLGLRPSLNPEVTQVANDARLKESSACRLLRHTVLQDRPGPEGDARAQRMVQALASLTGLAGRGLLDAARFCIEYSLLTSSDAERPRIIQLLEEGPDANFEVKRFAQELRNRSAGAVDRISVTTRFFVQTREREAAWRAYFEALTRPDIANIPEHEVSTLSVISSLGFLSAQSLLAGLLARFDADWQPVLNAYSYSVGTNAGRSDAFESLQASQWNCWLVWGPSIPVCQCEEWQGIYALQYGYGDENNSIPVIERGDASASKRGLEPVILRLADEKREATLAQVQGRLRWAPWLLREHGAGDAQPTSDLSLDLNAYDESVQGIGDSHSKAPRLHAARAQRALYREPISGRHHTVGLVLDAVDVPSASMPAAGPQHQYFSAYRWVIFLVARATMDGSTGPVRLGGKPYPRWPEHDGMRAAVEAARLWEDLLPVFVHANIADAPAVAFQKRTLADAALSLLRQVWGRKAALFQEQDLASGIRFLLVCSSDYTGCGCSLRFPTSDSIVEVLRERLAEESDRAFAAAVDLPSATQNDRPWGLRGFYSACHLPEIIGDYYSFVAQQRGRLGKRPSMRTGTMR